MPLCKNDSKQRKEKKIYKIDLVKFLDNFPT